MNPKKSEFVVLKNKRPFARPQLLKSEGRSQQLIVPKSLYLYSAEIQCPNYTYIYIYIYIYIYMCPYIYIYIKVN